MSEQAEQSECPRCRGTGKVVAAHVQACAACNGTGRVSPGYVSGYEEGMRVGRMIGAAEVTRAVEDVLAQRTAQA